MQTPEKSGFPLTPKPGDKVYHLNPTESTIIDFLRERTSEVILEEFELIYQIATFTSEEDTDKYAKDCLLDFYLVLEILKGRHDKVRETFIPEEYKRKKDIDKNE
jgi:hypothetical protein